MNRSRTGTIGVLAVCMLLLAVGCTTTTNVALRPQSHFSYPNSNVTPIGAVTGIAKASSFGQPTGVSAAMKEEAIQNALAQKPGADILIDFVEVEKMTVIPIIPIYSVTYSVEGTAAKMEVGAQELK